MRAEVIHGDCLAVMRGMPDASVDAVVTDPPYSSGGMFRGDRMQDVKTKYVSTDSMNQHRLGTFAGDSRDQRGFQYWCALWLSEALRISRPGGVCAVFCDWRQLPTTSDSLQAGGWVWRGIGVWHKPSARPVQGRFTNACEYVVWGTNGPRELEALGGSALAGHWTIASPRGEDREHITQKPVALMEKLVEIVPVGGTILDPFCGSGTTGLACVNRERNFIGIEREADYVEIARRRIANVAPLFA